MPQIVGLTGGIASGKSSVSSLWKSKGVCVIDADAIAREVVQPGKPALWLIRHRFGKSVINEDGSLNRPALGRLIFSDKRARADLNLRIHPFIILNMLTRLGSALFLKWKPLIVLDTPLLYESKTLLPFCSKVVVVTCSKDQQLIRMLARDAAEKSLSEEDAKKRLESQIPIEVKARRADIVIDNSHDIAQLECNAIHVLGQLRPSAVGEIAFRAAVLCCAAKLSATLARYASQAFHH